MSTTKSNIHGGKAHRRTKKVKEDTSKKITLPSNPNEQIAVITKKPGGSCIEIMYFEPVSKTYIKTNTLIPGKFFKRVFMNAGDFVMIEYNLRNPNECLIVQKYNENQTKQLRDDQYFDGLYRTYHKDTDGKTIEMMNEEEQTVFEDGNDNDERNMDDMIDEL